MKKHDIGDQLVYALEFLFLGVFDSVRFTIPGSVSEGPEAIPDSTQAPRNEP